MTQSVNSWTSWLLTFSPQVGCSEAEESMAIRRARQEIPDWTEVAHSPRARVVFSEHLSLTRGCSKYPASQVFLK